MSIKMLHSSPPCEAQTSELTSTSLLIHNGEPVANDSRSRFSRLPPFDRFFRYNQTKEDKEEGQ